MRKFFLGALVALLLPVLAQAHGFGYGGYGYGYNARFAAPFVSYTPVYPVAVYAYPAYCPAYQPAYAAPPPCPVAAPAPAPTYQAPAPVYEAPAPVYQPCGYGYTATLGVVPLYSYGGAVFNYGGGVYSRFYGDVFASHSLAFTAYNSRFLPGLSRTLVSESVRVAGRREVVRTRTVVRPHSVRTTIRTRR